MAATIAAGAAYAAPHNAIAFQHQRLISYTGVQVTNIFEPAIKVGPDGTIYTAANYHDKLTGVRGVELWSAPFGTALSSNGVIPPARGGQDVDIAVGSTGNLYDGTTYLQSLNNGTGSYGVGVGACPAGSIPTNMSSCYGQQKVDASHTDRPYRRRWTQHSLLVLP